MAARRVGVSRRGSALATAQTREGAAVGFGGSAGAAFAHRDALFFGWRRGRVIVVEQLSHRRRQAFFGQAFDDEHDRAARREGAYLVTDFHERARLGVRVVDAHVSGLTGGLRQGSRLENARCGEPTIDAYLVGDGAHGRAQS